MSNSIIKILHQFLHKLQKKEEDVKLKKFLSKFKKLSINIIFLEDFLKILGYAKFIKDLVTKNIITDFKIVKVSQNYSATVFCDIVLKKEYLRAFTFSCTIGVYQFCKALCNLEASLNLIPSAIYKNLGLVTLKATTMSLSMWWNDP